MNRRISVDASDLPQGTERGLLNPVGDDRVLLELMYLLGIDRGATIAERKACESEALGRGSYTYYVYRLEGPCVRDWTRRYRRKDDAVIIKVTGDPVDAVVAYNLTNARGRYTDNLPYIYEVFRWRHAYVIVSEYIRYEYEYVFVGPAYQKAWADALEALRLAMSNFPVSDKSVRNSLSQIARRLEAAGVDLDDFVGVLLDLRDISERFEASGDVEAAARRFKQWSDRYFEIVRRADDRIARGVRAVLNGMRDLLKHGGSLWGDSHANNVRFRAPKPETACIIDFGYSALASYLRGSALEEILQKKMRKMENVARANVPVRPRRGAVQSASFRVKL